MAPRGNERKPFSKSNTNPICFAFNKQIHLMIFFHFGSELNAVTEIITNALHNNIIFVRSNETRDVVQEVDTTALYM